MSGVSAHANPVQTGDMVFVLYTFLHVLTSAGQRVRLCCNLRLKLLQPT
jgi:hypothetical protein